MIETRFNAAAIRPEVLSLVRTRFVRNVYTWMAGGLALSALTALLVASTPALLQAIVTNPILFFGLMIAEVGMVLWLSIRVHKMSARTASWVFLGYSVLNGATLSVIFLAYTATSIMLTLAVAASVFAAAAVYGATTKRDLTSVGALAFMGLIGLIIASLVGYFFHLPKLAWILNYVGVVIFVALAAYDAQKIQRMGVEAAASGEAALSRYAILGALALYLDFVNLFLLLLRIFGSQRD